MGRGRPAIDDKHYYDWKRVIEYVERHGGVSIREACRGLCAAGFHDYELDTELNVIQRIRTISDPDILRVRFFEAQRKWRDPKIAWQWNQQREGYPDCRKRCVPTYISEADRILVPATARLNV